MVAMGFSSLCMASSMDKQASIQNQAPLFLHIFRKVEQHKLHTSASGDLSAAASVTRHDSYAYSTSAERTTHQFAHPTSSSHASCEDPELPLGSAARHHSILYSALAESTSRRITGSCEAFITKDVLESSLSYEHCENGVLSTKQGSIIDTTHVLRVKDGDSLSQFTSGLASNESGLDIISKEETANDALSASIRMQAIEVAPADTTFCISSSSKEHLCDRHFDASPAADGNNNFIMQGEVANDAICESSFAVKIVDITPDTVPCASTSSKDAHVGASNAVHMKGTSESTFGQFAQNEVTSDDSFSAAMEESVFVDDFVASTPKVMYGSRFCASTMKEGREYVTSVIPIVKSVKRFLDDEREVTHDAGFMIMADAEHDFYSEGSAQEVIVSTTKTDKEHDNWGAHTTHLLNHVGTPSITAHSKWLENHPAEDFDRAPNEEKLFVSDTEKKERCKCYPGTSHSWQDLWHFQEESNDDLTALVISESDYDDVINAVLDIAKNLSKNEVLQDHLHPYSGRIDHLCGNAILYKLQKERLFVSAFSCFEWLRVHTPCLLTSRSLCTIFTISGEANMINRGLLLFNNLKHNKKIWSVQVFNALLSALSKHCRYDEALSVFQEMSNKEIQPDHVTFCILMNLAKRSGSGVKVLWQIFCDMEEQKVFAGHEVFAVLMKAFCEEGSRDEALKLLSVMEGRGLIPNVVIYNILIDAFGKSGLLEEAEGLVSEMKAKGICMSVVTYNILIDAYGNTRNFEVAEALLQEMLDKGPEPNVCSYTALIAAYGRHFLSEKAASVFLRMKKNGVPPNAVAYTALIHAYAEDGWHEKAEYTFENMRREGLIPSVETYTSLLHAFRQAGELRKVKSVWKMMRSERCTGTRATFNVLLDACAKHGDYAEARDVMYEFNKIGIKPDRKTYNMLINAYARGGQHSRAPEILKEMKNAGFSPDSFTYTTLIFSFLRVRDFTQAFKYHEKMCRDNQLPDNFTYRKLRAVLDEKYEIKTERNMKAFIGAQRAQYTLVKGKEKVKSFYGRQIPLSGRRRKEVPGV